MSHQRGRKILIVLGSMVLIALITTYIVFVRYFQEHFFLHTTVNHRDFSQMTVGEVEDIIENQEKGYLLEISERGNIKETILAEEIGVRAVFGNQIKEIKAQQNPYLWFTCLFRDSSYTVSTLIEYDEKKFNAKMDKLNCLQKKNQKEPENAYIADYSGGGYVIVPEVEGSTLKREETIKLISDAVKHLKESIDLEEEKCYVEPTIRKDYEPMTAALKQLNDYVGVSMVYKFGKTKEVLDGEKTHKWVSMDEDYQVSFNYKKLDGYIEKLAQKYDTYQKEISFHTTVGTTVQFTAYNYGWVMDQKKMVKQLKNAIKKGESFEKKPSFVQEGFGGYSKSLGKNYIEIDITGQHIYCYRDGKLAMDTAVVTGCVSKGMSTPTGIYTVYTKMRDHVMRGPDYAQFVSFFMPFNGGIGFHDANWRSSFGGSNYVYNGSHGCINMVHSAAEQLYGLVDVGIPVIVYKAENAIAEEEVTAKEEKKKKSDSKESDEVMTAKEESDDQKPKALPMEKASSEKDKNEKDKTDKSKEETQVAKAE